MNKKTGNENYWWCTDIKRTLQIGKPRSFVVKNSVENDIWNLLNETMDEIEWCPLSVGIHIYRYFPRSLCVYVFCSFFCWRVLYLSFIMGWFNWFAFGHQTDGINVGIPIVTLCTIFSLSLFHLFVEFFQVLSSRCNSWRHFSPTIWRMLLSFGMLVCAMLLRKF